MTFHTHKNRRCYLDASYFNHEHSSSQHMAGVVAPELDPSHLLDLMEVNGLNLVHALLQVRLSVQHVIGRNVAAIRQSQSYFECVFNFKGALRDGKYRST